jgi:glycerol 2-dehydrogenase (NADP+)
VTDPTKAETHACAGWNFHDIWEAMEEVLESGKVRAIGVANFGIRNLESLLETANVVPAVNLIEHHPYCPSTKLVELCKSKGIHVISYPCWGPYGAPFHDKALLSVCNAHGKSPRQIFIAWALKRGASVLTSAQEWEDKSKYGVDDLELTVQDMDKLNSLQARFQAGGPYCTERIFWNKEEGRDFYDGDKLFEREFEKWPPRAV